MYEVIIVGGGPAGLSAGLILARAQRRILIVDAGQGRNSRSSGVHLLFSREGTPPRELAAATRQSLADYPNVEFRAVEAVGAAQNQGGFEITLADSSIERAERLVLATGVVDQLPMVEGLAERWGDSVVLCPYCDGWERRGQPMGLLVTNPEHIRLGLILTRWSSAFTVFTNDACMISEVDRRLLSSLGAAVCEEAVVRLEGSDRSLEQVRLKGGAAVPCSLLFVHPQTTQRSDLARQLQCNIFDDDSVEIDHNQQTTVPGVYAAGDMARQVYLPTPIAYVVAAATSGVLAGGFIDMDLFNASMKA